MSYALPKLADFSPAALDGAVRELFSALEQESAAAASENDWSLPRSLDGAQEWHPDSAQ
jgi:hypothetical protein